MRVHAPKTKTYVILHEEIENTFLSMLEVDPELKTRDVPTEDVLQYMIDDLAQQELYERAHIIQLFLLNASKVRFKDGNLRLTLTIDK